ncbi:MAG: N-acetylmuramoyl-L-alanine amidase [Polyangiaceae bacterium]|nr:N-acetylmuramoyl-L-alanine amidase [Polyangiaceae bacterium]
MATVHKVKSGESLSVIAQQYGFRSWKAIYDHPSNSDFRKRRPNPNLIMAGDEISIPEKTSKAVEAGTGKEHTYKAASGKQKIEFLVTFIDSLSLTDAVPELTATLSLPDGTKADHKADTKGTIHLVEPDISSGKVDVVNIWDAREPAIIRYGKYATWGLSTNQSNVVRLPDKRKIINRIASKHGITRRSTWGKKTVNYLTMDEDWDYTTVVIHHSGNGGETDPVAIETKHMDERGWDDVGYHYLVRPDGSIYEGRHLAYKGTHVLGANSNKIGILMMGDFESQWYDDDDDVSAAHMSAAQALVITLKAEFATITKLGGHRDYKTDTECPGGDLYSQLPAMRAATGLGGP